MEDLIQTITIYAIPLIFAITLHEAAHGYIARYFGDNTAAMAGRITLNPLKHIDPVGTILVPAVILTTSTLMGGAGLLFGWAKPVPVNFGQLRRPKRDMLWVAAAGPAANLVMALFWTLVLAGLVHGGLHERFFINMAAAGIQVNIVLMIFNLLPLPPLDGGRIVFSLLPHQMAWRYAKLEPYGIPILILLLITGVLQPLLAPIYAVSQALMYLALP